MEVAQRILITIPDNLHERLQVVKEKLNVSRICARAIDQAVQVEEIKARTDIPIQEKAILRLRLEKQEGIGYWKQQGFNKGGRDAAEKLPYGEIKYVAESGLLPPPEPNLTTYYDVTELKNNPGFDEQGYQQGWIEGVTHFWKQVKNQVEQPDSDAQSDQAVQLDLSELKEAYVKALPLKTEDYKKALLAISNELPHSYKSMLQAHYHAPSQIITAAQLAQAAQYKGYEAANIHYGKIGRKIAEYLKYEPPTHTNGKNDKAPFWSIVLADGYENNKQQWYWALRPQVAQALEDLGWV